MEHLQISQNKIKIRANTLAYLRRLDPETLRVALVMGYADVMVELNR